MKKVEEIKFKEGERSHAGMTVPEGFFQQFQQKLEAEIDRRESRPAQTPSPVIGRRPLFQRWAVAAAVVLLLGVGFFIYNSVGEEDALTPGAAQLAANTEEADVSASDAEEMLIGSVNDYDLYDLYCDIY